MIYSSSEACEAAGLEQGLQDYIQWLKNKALPVWATRGLDEEGASVEQFNADGTVDRTSNKRVRVQARQMFVFASAQSRGWLENGAELVAGLDSFCGRHAWIDRKGRYAHLLGPENAIIDEKTDIYDIAFFLLAYAWRYQVFHDLKALDKANKILSDMDLGLKGDPGGWIEGDYDAPYRRQNPHMHLFEAFIALYNATRDGKWLAKAGELYCLFETAFFEGETGVLREYFSPGWKVAPGQKGAIIEPGHMMEWVWLLRQYQKVTGAPVDRYCHALYHRAAELGFDPETGLLFNEVMLDGRHHRVSKRCWPMTEWLKAALAQDQAVGSEHDYRSDALAAITGIQKYFLRPAQPGLYVDAIGAEGKIINDKAPASTLYHLMVAGMEAQAFLQGVGTQ